MLKPVPIDVFILSGPGVFLMERLYYFSDADANINIISGMENKLLA